MARPVATVVDRRRRTIIRPAITVLPVVTAVRRADTADYPAATAVPWADTVDLPEVTVDLPAPAVTAISPGTLPALREVTAAGHLAVMVVRWQATAVPRVVTAAGLSVVIVVPQEAMAVPPEVTAVLPAAFYSADIRPVTTKARRPADTAAVVLLEDTGVAVRSEDTD